MMENNYSCLLTPYGFTQFQLLEEFFLLQRELLPLPLRQPGRINAFGWDIEFVSGPAVIANLQYQVLKRINDFSPDNEAPLILDIGSNIGISVLHYKRMFPKARIIAFEPDPEFLPVLKNNLKRNAAADVEVVEAAAWVANGEARWLCEGIDGSKLTQENDEQPGLINVRTVDLSDYVDQDIDLIKMDVEGAELTLIPHLAGKLKRVKNLSIECHLTEGSSFSLFGAVLITLQNEGFKLSLNSYSLWRDLIRYNPVPNDHFSTYIALYGWKQERIHPEQGWGYDPNSDIGLYWDQIAKDQQVEQLSEQLRNMNELLQKTSSQYFEVYDLLQKTNSQYLETQDLYQKLTQHCAEIEKKLNYYQVEAEKLKK